MFVLPPVYQIRAMFCLVLSGIFLYTEDDMPQDITSAEMDFFLAEPDRLATYLALRDQVLSLDPSMAVLVQKTAISFRAPRPFLYVGHPFRKHNPGWPVGCLQISFSATAAVRHPAVIHNTPIRANLYTIHALVAPPGHLDGELADLVRQSLHLKNKRRPS